VALNALYSSGSMHRTARQVTEQVLRAARRGAQI